MKFSRGESHTDALARVTLCDPWDLYLCVYESCTCVCASHCVYETYTCVLWDLYFVCMHVWVLFFSLAICQDNSLLCNFQLLRDFILKHMQHAHKFIALVWESWTSYLHLRISFLGSFHVASPTFRYIQHDTNISHDTSNISCFTPFNISFNFFICERPWVQTVKWTQSACVRGGCNILCPTPPP